MKSRFSKSGFHVFEFFHYKCVHVPMEQSLEKLVSCETFDCGSTMSSGPMLFVDSLSTRLISSLKLACRSRPGDTSCCRISDLSAIVVRNLDEDGEALFCLARCCPNPAITGGSTTLWLPRVRWADRQVTWWCLKNSCERGRIICMVLFYEGYMPVDLV